MSLRASVHLDLKTTGASEAKAAVRGVMQATQRAADETKKAAAAEKAKIKENERALRRFAQVVSETAKAKLKAERDAAKAGLAATRDADRRAEASAKALAKTRIDEARRAAREDERWAAAKLRTMGRIAREEERQAAAAGRQRAQGVRNARRGLIQTAAGVATLGITGVNEVRQFGSTLGVRSREEMVQRSMGFERGLIRLGGQAGLSPERQAATRARMLEVSRTTQTDPMDLLASASMAQNRFSDFSFFENNAQRFAEAANALDTPMEDIVGAVGEFQRQMGVTSEEIPQLIGVLTSAAQAGSIEFADISGEFAQTIGTWARVTGQTGMSGAREFTAAAEVLGAGGMGGAGANTLMTNLLAKMSSGEVQGDMRRAGIRMNDPETGQFVGMPALVEQLVARNVTPTQLQGILGRDMQANQAMGILMSEVRKAQAEGRANPLRAIAASSETDGNSMIDRTNAALLNSTAGRARQVGVNAEIAFMQNGDQLIQAMTNMAGPLTELENRFPRVAQGLETFQGALASLLAVFAGLRLAGGGAALAGVVNSGAGTATTAALGGGVGAAATTSLLPWLATGAASLVAGLGIGEGLNRLGGVPSLTSVFTGEEDDYMVRAREEERRRQASRGTVGTYRDIIQRRSSSIGLYGEVEAGSMAELLENARRQFSAPGQGGNLASVMQKMRDVGADDDMMRTPANRETWERAEQQVNRDRQQITEPIVRALGEVRTAIQTAPAPAPATGSTTGPTVTR